MNVAGSIIPLLIFFIKLGTELRNIFKTWVTVSMCTLFLLYVSLKALHTHGKPTDCVGMYRLCLIAIWLTLLALEILHFRVIPSIALPTFNLNWGLINQNKGKHLWGCARPLYLLHKCHLVIYCHRMVSYISAPCERASDLNRFDFSRTIPAKIHVPMYGFCSFRSPVSVGFPQPTQLASTVQRFINKIIRY